MISIQVKYSIEDNVIIYNLNNEYGIHAESIHFIPVGDSAYSYRVDCFDEHKYYLKLFDHQNDGHQKSVERLRFYLPLTWQMYHRGLFTNITYPLANKNGGFQTMFSDITIVLFNFIDGESLAQAYPFSPKILRTIAESMAKIEGVTPLIDPDIVLTETFDTDFGFDLKRCISVLEGLTPRDSVKRKLQDCILPEKDRILAFQKIIQELRLKAIADTRPKVLCHGDIWGGNLIRNADRLYFIDWESAVLAPFELNLLNFIGDDFEIFYTQYIRYAGKAAAVSLDILRFYCYRRHLRNLTSWLLNILFRNHEDAQNHNDLDMILYHCMNRWDSIEPNLNAAKEIWDRGPSAVPDGALQRSNTFLK